jgi:hypothetical protein
MLISTSSSCIRHLLCTLYLLAVVVLDIIMVVGMVAASADDNELVDLVPKMGG